MVETGLVKPTSRAGDTNNIESTDQPVFEESEVGRAHTCPLLTIFSLESYRDTLFTLSMSSLVSRSVPSVLGAVFTNIKEAKTTTKN